MSASLILVTSTHLTGLRCPETMTLLICSMFSRLVGVTSISTAKLV